MRTLRVCLLALGLGSAAMVVAGPAAAVGKAAKSGRAGAAPTASADEVNKLKAVRLGDPKAGTFKWGLSPEDVMTQVKMAIEKRYQPRIEEAAQDPGMQQRIRAELRKETEAVEKSLTKFDGQKTGWDVSIIGPEFQQNTGEAVLVAKEDIWTRYFFFFEGGLYKMFLAFNKDAIEGKTFADFGKDMQSKFGKSREIFRDEKMKGGVRRLLDHYEWNAQGDRLRLIDRSEFYGVYCLVLHDGKTSDRLLAKRKIVNPQQSSHDALVEAVTAKEKNDRDANDNIIDRITGKNVKKPGEDQAPTITVPSPSSNPTPAAAQETTKVETSPPPATPPPAPKSKTAGKNDRQNPLKGLDL